MNSHSSFGPLVLICLVALIIPVVTSRIRLLRVPIVVGEILAGILIGQTGLNLIHSTPSLAFLSEFGFAFLMFLSGLEVDFKSLTSGYDNDRGDNLPRKFNPLAVAGASFGITLLLAISAGFILQYFELAKNPYLMGLILSTTSVGMVVPILKERSLLGQQYGQTILLTAVLSDFVTLLLLSLNISIIRGGLQLDVFIFMALLAVFAALLRVGQHVINAPVLSSAIRELSQATAQIQVRGAFALMVLWVLLADSLGMEVILGAFIAGTVVSLLAGGQESELRSKLDAIGYGFFIPIFFIMVGVTFDGRTLLASPTALLSVPALVFAAYLVKLLPALTLRRYFDWRHTLGAGFLLSSRLSLIIAAAAIAFQLGVISSATHSALILVAIVTCTFSPLIFMRLLPQKEERTRHGIIIVGTDQMARLLDERLRVYAEPVTHIGHNQKGLQIMEQAGIEVIHGDPTNPQVLEKAGARQARCLVALSASPQVVIDVCRIGAEVFQIPQIIARADSLEQIDALRQMQVHVVQPALATVVALEAALRFPTAFAMLLSKSDSADVLDVKLTKKKLIGKSLRHVNLPGNALVIGIRRKGEIIVPNGSTVLRTNDILMLIGSREALLLAQELVSTNSPAA